MKFEENLTLQQFKVIQGHRSWCQWKAHIGVGHRRGLHTRTAVSDCL